MQMAFYTMPKALMQRPAAEALVRAHRSLRRHGLGLMIHDTYRIENKTFEQILGTN
jgi:D-alanyl-D-alanine dipeptidase